MNVSDELLKLHQLQQAGALTDEEFAKAKAAILSSQSGNSAPADDRKAPPTDQVSEQKPPLTPLPAPLARRLGETAGQLQRDLSVLPDSSRKALTMIAVGVVFVATFVGALLLSFSRSNGHRTSTQAALPTPTPTPSQESQELKVASVERSATGQLKEYFAFVKSEYFPEQEKVIGPLPKGGRYGKHRFQILHSDWSIEPNKESTAYPYRGSIKIKYCRFATVAHETKEQAEIDSQFFVANYDVMGWLPDAKLAKLATTRFPERRLKVITLMFDRAANKWDLQSERID